MSDTFRFSAELWLWRPDSSWHFVSLPFDVADAISAIPLPPKGFGSVKVRATVGPVTWETSVFPTSETYMLPIKKQVRAANDLEVGSVLDVELEVVR